MAVSLARHNASAARKLRAAADALDIAIVNNMPDAALRSTERQLADAVAAGAGRTPVRLHLFSLPAAPRGAEAKADIATRYGAIDDLYGRRFDGLIVTGAEPRAANLRQEPYWDAFCELVDWARTSVGSSLWSCLAAHAAVLRLDGVERRPLPSKLSGVYAATPTCAHPLVDGLGRQVMTPHSRLNELREADLAAAGYSVLLRSEEAGVDLFVRAGDGRMVFLQGHQEYETDTLLREFRRDVGRYLRGERDTWPAEPENYFNPEALAILRAYRRRAATNRAPELFDVFPNVNSPFAITNRWQVSTTRLYRNWIGMMGERKAVGNRQ